MEKNDIIVEIVRDKDNILSGVFISIEFFYMDKKEQAEMFERIRNSVNAEIIKSAH